MYIIDLTFKNVQIHSIKSKVEPWLSSSLWWWGKEWFDVF